jgi:acetylornithine deacetylase/succinyl-diaminopimelate desuccinylase-like protein
MEKYLTQLVAMPTVSNDAAANSAALTYLHDFFESRGLHVMRYNFNGFSSLVATVVKDSKAPKVMLTGHTDVVPAPAELFYLREENGKWFGRGVYDMKFALASYMDIVDRLAASGTLQQYDFGVMITSDEETGGQEGTRRLVETGYRPGICVLPDGGQDWNIETLAKGLSYGHIYVNGKTAHGSRPWEGDSAIFRLMELLQELRTFFGDMSFNTNTLNVGLIDGGEAINQLPSKAHATLDIRYIKHSDRPAIYDKILQLCEKYGAEYTEEFYDVPCITDLEHPLVKPFAESIQRVTGHAVSGTMSMGGSDARHLAKANIPAILTHPEGGSQHAGGEWIDKQGALQFGDVLFDYLQKVAKHEAGA